VTESFGKKLDRDTAAQLSIGRLIHVAHAPRTEVGRDLEMGEFGPDHDMKENLSADSIKIPGEGFSI
jgi:hypothetical protein